MNSLSWAIYAAEVAKLTARLDEAVGVIHDYANDLFWGIR